MFPGTGSQARFPSKVPKPSFQARFPSKVPKILRKRFRNKVPRNRFRKLPKVPKNSFEARFQRAGSQARFLSKVPKNGFPRTGSQEQVPKDSQRFPRTGSQARSPGTGSHIGVGRFPRIGVQEQVPRNRFPGTGFQARLPSKSSEAKLPGTDLQARCPSKVFVVPDRWSVKGVFFSFSVYLKQLSIIIPTNLC